MKTKWRVLKEVIKTEVELAKQELKDLKKRKDWTSMMTCNQDKDSLNWILDQMKIIEETEKELKGRQK